MKYSQNYPLIRHAAFSIHSFQDQSWSYKLYRWYGRIFCFIQMCKRCQPHLKAEYSTVELATQIENGYVDTIRIKQNDEIKALKYEIKKYIKKLESIWNIKMTKSDEKIKNFPIKKEIKKSKKCQTIPYFYVIHLFQSKMRVSKLIQRTHNLNQLR